ncbi:MAG: aminoglycoside phosphotransferase family protein [Clostridia bacterium]|nr:aminoglycoside phosphotransferase family protein [Clostridia bacterium]MBQ4628704.1 aminoglycoside phosphotransferase family protein [Clostridia bacterium]
MDTKIRDICREFKIKGEYLSYEEITIGNVNKTYKVNFRNDDGTISSYVVQEVNTYVFKSPEQVMENIANVTEFIYSKRPDELSLHYYHTIDHKTYLLDKSGFWRLFNYIPSATYNVCDDLEIVCNAGTAFGEFQMLLSDFDASKLHETIPHFHNTRKRYEKLIESAKADPCGRVKEVEKEIEWLLSVQEKACTMTDMRTRGELPLRVTHNDTKINNVLFDKTTKKALVVIDLDTVMPGLVGHDFGDAIRFATNFVEEDCKDFEKAGVNLDVFTAFTKGFIKQTVHTLTENELNTLALGSFVLACELSTRFLDDYITGDKYFKIRYPEHNLVRTRCQIALAKDMLTKMDKMNDIVSEFAKKYR